MELRKFEGSGGMNEQFDCYQLAYNYLLEFFLPLYERKITEEEFNAFVTGLSEATYHELLSEFNLFNAKLASSPCDAVVARQINEFWRKVTDKKVSSFDIIIFLFAITENSCLLTFSFSETYRSNLLALRKQTFHFE